MVSRGCILLTIAIIFHTCNAFALSKKGFGAEEKVKPKGKAPKADDKAAEQIARSLFGVCSHLQNPELYSPSWANVCKVDDGGGGAINVVATENIARGDIVSFYPVHSVGLRGSGDKNNNKKKKKAKNRRSTDYLVFDSELDGSFFGSKRRTASFCIDFPAMTDRSELRGQALFLDANPDRQPVPGWIGHLCRKGDKQNANCVAIPVEGAAPLCMVVAISEIKEGENLIRDIASNEGETLVKDRITQSGEISLAKYASQLSELKAYIDMAYPKVNIDQINPYPEQEIDAVKDDMDTSSTNKSSGSRTFKKINLDYPGLQEFNRDPDIYAVDNFLTADECKRIIAKCQPKMAPCVTKDPVTGVVGPDSSRTSTEAMLPRAEAPSIVSKITSLLECREEQLEILQVLRYEQGQEFKPHTDGFEGPVTAAGFENSGRLVTIFTYLNDVPQGGHTNFCELNFSVAPKQGSAIIHFPASENLEEDKRTVHQGKPAINEKWLLATWVWQHERTDAKYSETNLPRLSEDVI